MSPWKQALLRNVEGTGDEEELSVIAGGDEEELSVIAEHVPILMCSDGGQIDKAGSFGWVIGTEERTLWKGSGRVGGANMSSFKAETHGCLAVTSFLRAYAELYGMQWEKCNITFWCDNKGLLTRLERFENRTSDKISYFTEPEQDCVEVISKMWTDMQGAGADISRKHVKGHQDSTKTWGGMSREAQLNVEADSLATRELDDIAVYSTQTTKQIEVDECRCYFVHKAEIVTSKEELTLRNAITTKKMTSYLMIRNHWSQEQFESIDWTQFASARRKSCPIQRRFVSKFVHGWLPTASRLFRQNQRTTNECTLCGLPETNTHMFRCDKRSKWKRLFGIWLGAKLRALNTDPTIKRSIENMFTDFLGEDDEDTAKHHPAYMMLRGYIYKWYANQQQKYIDLVWDRIEGTSRQHDTGCKWTQQIIEFMWSEARELWLLRNDDTHTTVIKITELSKKVLKMYSERNEALATDRRIIFKWDAEALIMRGPVAMQEWIERHERLLEISKKRARLAAVANVRRLEFYFSPRVDQTNRRGE